MLPGVVVTPLEAEGGVQLCRTWLRVAGRGYRGKYTGENTERERPPCPESLFPWSVHGLFYFLFIHVFTSAPYSEIDVQCTLQGNKWRDGESGHRDASLKRNRRTLRRSDAACQRREPLPELYEYEPLSVEAEAGRKHGDRICSQIQWLLIA